MNRIGVLRSDSLNIHAALFGVNDAQTLILAVVQHCQVNLTIDVDAFVDEN